MEIIVQKFGGSSVANTDKLVVSAQGDTTDDIILEEKEITNEPNKREHDVLVSVGEQITVAKLAMCLQKLEYDAVSYLGWQLPIITDSNYGDANILKIKTNKILKALKENKIVVVAGFQGIDQNDNITTLGRGGSDTTAIALAAALKAEKCEIFTDVDGVYSKDPNKSKDAIKFETITYDKMLEMANV